jgi:hypothetical protein
MDIAIVATLSTAVGVIIGARIAVRKEKNTLGIWEIKPTNRISENQKINKSGNLRLDELEIRFIKNILEDNSIGVSELNKILRIEKLSKENQRQRRHIFVKELNIKLSLSCKLRESIVRVPSETDARSKFYRFDKRIVQEHILENILH